MKDIKTFLKNKKTKGQKRSEKDINILLEKKKKCQYYGELNKNLSKAQKRKLVECRRNYYIRHNKELLTIKFNIIFYDYKNCFKIIYFSLLCLINR